MGDADSQAKIEVTVGWVVGLVACSLGFLLAIVSVTLPWTFVYPRPGQRVTPGGPTDPFLTRISNYEPASTVTVLMVIGFALIVAACFGTSGWVNAVLRVAAPAIGTFGAWFIGIAYIVVLRTVDYGYTREVGEAVRFDRAIYNTVPATGLSLCCFGVLLMAVGSALARRPLSLPHRAVGVQLDRLGYVCAGVALVMLLGSFSEPWLRQPPDPSSVSRSWGGPPQLASWLVVFRFTTIAALIFLTVLLVSKSARVRNWMARAGIVTCGVTVVVLLTGRMIAWVPAVTVDIRPTYYLAVGAAVLLMFAFLDAALGEVVRRLRESS
ncbi:hypothetical protein GCM10029976_047920 [Kribbella albertanoniae]|uniref:Uncharacterized protein n=1 Tax=Kribbella albertanoniae TaxID=1266829 RepID=A0A4R4PU40_9ACTN|nr:hypothetical protein [Kribbella albertanoniae]TDC25789.1 hypothetical protein E1261_23580 [Kribbella albertanoniae]